MKNYNVICRADGKKTTAIVSANNTNEALMTYLKSISSKEGKLPKDYKIKIELI